ncbi:MAG: transglutaminase domain-containing protein [Deltaproteobacteria bacterium]|nr:transglutaminase domain-containing protein [Deltaproteobacteria bacterium]
MNEETKNVLQSSLKPTFTIDSDHEKIVEKAKLLTEDCSTETEKAVKLFYFVRDSIPYNLFMSSVFEEDYKASRVLAWGKGFCVQKAVLLAALGRAAGIPSRLLFATIKNHRVPPHIIEELGTNIFYAHGYNQFFLNGRWINATATFDKIICHKQGVPVVEFDGTGDATLPKKDLKGKPYIEYLKQFPPTDDVPSLWIAQTISKTIGKSKRPWLKKDQD